MRRRPGTQSNGGELFLIDPLGANQKPSWHVRHEVYFVSPARQPASRSRRTTSESLRCWGRSKCDAFTPRR